MALAGDSVVCVAVRVRLTNDACAAKQRVASEHRNASLIRINPLESDVSGPLARDGRAIGIELGGLEALTRIRDLCRAGASEGE